MQGRSLQLQEQWHAPQPLLDTGTVAARCLHVVQMFAYLLCFVFNILYLVWFLILWFHHREHAPPIIFMDEIDSIGSARMESRSGNGDSEVQRTMLELLNQLDGFEASNKIKVLECPQKTIEHCIETVIHVTRYLF